MGTSRVKSIYRESGAYHLLAMGLQRVGDTAYARRWSLQEMQAPVLPRPDEITEGQASWFASKSIQLLVR